MQLQYDITVTGEQNIRRALRGVESEIAASGKRATATAAKMPGGATARRSTDRDAVIAARKIERETIAGQRRIAKEEAAATKVLRCSCYTLPSSYRLSCSYPLVFLKMM